jgi:PPK2 family polyphosphate:nucleotide phosphotransferase
MRKEDALRELASLDERLRELQQLFYACEKHALLIILQGMDTSGKDGVIRHAMDAFNPQACQVTPFKAPTAEELGHDFLWRIHRATPRRGTIGIFSRSHYEDVLIVRVENLVPEPVWRARYQAINDFERNLSESGTIVLKFYLHISKEEQRQRLQARLENPSDQWKFRLSDLQARAKWDEYMSAYEDALNASHTDAAPWHVIPANRKWYRNLLVTRAVAAKLEALKLEWPPLEPAAVGITIE